MTEQLAPNPKYFQNFGIFLLLTIINTILAAFAIISFPQGPGISALYLAIGFEIAFTLWFGMYGAIATYCGSVITGILISGFSPEFSLIWSAVNFFQVLLPLLAFRNFQGNISLNTKRDFGIYLCFGVILNNILGAFLGNGLLALTGAVTSSDLPRFIAIWFVGNLIVVLIITTTLLRYATPALAAKGLLVKGFWK